MRTTRPAIRMSEEKLKLHIAIKEYKVYWKALSPFQRKEIKLARREKRKQAQIDYLAENKIRLAVEHQKYSLMIKELKVKKPVVKLNKVKIITVPEIKPYPMIRFRH